MKKHFAILTTVSLLLASCNGNKTNNTETTEDESAVKTEFLEDVNEDASAGNISQDTQEEPTEEDETGYSAPFSVKIVHEYQNMHYYRETYIFNILKNGKLTGSVKDEFKDANYGNKWEDRGTTEFTGKWSTNLITRGDGYQKVYAIDRSDREDTYYMPDDCEYIWMCDYAYLACEDYDLRKAMKVTSVTKL